MNRFDLHIKIILKLSTLFMDKEILDLYKEFLVTGALSKVEYLSHLSKEESEVYDFLLQKNLRIEQERLTHLQPF